MRTSIFATSSPPTGFTSRSCSTRSSLFWISDGCRDLIEEQGPAVRLAEEAPARAVAPR